MFGTRERPMATEGKQDRSNRAIRIAPDVDGFLLDDSRLPFSRGRDGYALHCNFCGRSSGANLDYLGPRSLPPGTGDIQLTIVQTVALSGAIIVTTPQEVALIDARKAATMFDKVNVPVLGLIENMSYFVSPSDGKALRHFGSGGGEREAKRLRVPLLGQIPIDIATREAGDRGMPITGEDRESPVAAEFKRIAERLSSTLALVRHSGSSGAKRDLNKSPWLPRRTATGSDPILID